MPPADLLPVTGRGVAGPVQPTVGEVGPTNGSVAVAIQLLPLKTGGAINTKGRRFITQLVHWLTFDQLPAAETTTPIGLRVKAELPDVRAPVVAKCRAAATRLPAFAPLVDGLGIERLSPRPG